jgi:hypothetical protein
MTLSRNLDVEQLNCVNLRALLKKAKSMQHDTSRKAQSAGSGTRLARTLESEPVSGSISKTPLMTGRGIHVWLYSEPL